MKLSMLPIVAIPAGLLKLMLSFFFFFSFVVVFGTRTILRETLLV